MDSDAMAGLIIGVALETAALARRSPPSAAVPLSRQTPDGRPGAGHDQVPGNKCCPAPLAPC